MFARVRLLRKDGELIQTAQEHAVWDHGIFEVKKRPRHLVLREAQSSPDTGVIVKLFSPVFYDLTTFPAEELLFRGFELIETKERRAMVCQEWAVVLGGKDLDTGVKLRKYR